MIRNHLENVAFNGVVIRIVQFLIIVLKIQPESVFIVAGTENRIKASIFNVYLYVARLLFGRIGVYKMNGSACADFRRVMIRF